MTKILPSFLKKLLRIKHKKEISSEGFAEQAREIISRYRVYHLGNPPRQAVSHLIAAKKKSLNSKTIKSLQEQVIEDAIRVADDANIAHSTFTNFISNFTLHDIEWLSDVAPSKIEAKFNSFQISKINELKYKNLALNSKDLTLFNEIKNMWEKFSSPSNIVTNVEVTHTQVKSPENPSIPKGLVSEKLEYWKNQAKQNSQSHENQGLRSR